MNSALQKLNTRAVGYAGLASGGASIISAVWALYTLLCNAKYDTSLYYALVAARQHAASHDDVFAIMQLVAACFAIFGGLVIGLVLSYIGRPRTIPTGNHPSLASILGSPITMNTLENIAGDVLADAVAVATADKTSIENWITTNGVKLANEGQTLIDNFVNGLNLGPFISPFKATIVSGINAELQNLIAQGKSEVDVLLDLVLATASAEAKKLQAA